MSKKIYLVQVSAVYGESVKTAYLPYASGCLASYAFADERVSSEYEFGRFVFLRESIGNALNSLDEPFLVGFSSYIWNMEYNKEFARRLKERYPACIVVFGGHNITPDGGSLKDMPYADILIHGEGEEPFKALLIALAGGSIADVGSISYRDESGEIITTPMMQPGDISAYPSPYLGGWFDSIITESGIAPSIIWETNRGCPNRCAFCDWGALKSKVRCFPDERVEAELQWMVKNKIEYVYCADANFGIFPRDTLIADRIIELNRTEGYPQVFKTNYTKNKDDTVFEISKKLIDAGIGKSPTLSFQSLSPDVLNNIGRSNMELERFKSLMARYSAAGVPVYSELILGLPGETYGSFSSGISHLLECNQHTAIGIYPCELLPNSLMGSAAYRERFSIKTARARFDQYHCKESPQDVTELSNIVVSTSTMSVEDWERSFIFSICVQAFHNLGLTRELAMYLYAEKGISYKAFYERLIGWMDSLGGSGVCGAAFAHLKELTHGITQESNSLSVPFGDKEIITWSFEEYVFLRIVFGLDGFAKELKAFAEGFDADGGVTAALLDYQLAVIKQPGVKEKTIESDYDFYDYFRRICADEYAPLQKKKSVIHTSGEAPESRDDFARICVWYGRRDDAQLYTGNKNTVTREI